MFQVMPPGGGICIFAQRACVISVQNAEFLSSAADKSQINNEKRAKEEQILGISLGFCARTP